MTIPGKAYENAKEMLDFIERSPSCYHVVANVKTMLKEAGYLELSEAEDWTECLKEETGTRRFFVVRNDSSLIAVQMPGGKARGFHISAAHSDSPCYKIKEKPEITVEGAYTKLNVEGYGGMIRSTWLDRPLSVAGRIAVETPEGIRTQLVCVDRDLCVIPNLAIHMNRGMNEGFEYNQQVDMLPLFGDGEVEKGDLLKVVAEAAGLYEGEEPCPDRILGHDLFLYTRQKGLMIGTKGEFVMSPRLDDLQCVFAEVKGLLAAEPGNFINVCVVFDNEEVGSGTRQGADSTFLEDVLQRICAVRGGDGLTLEQRIPESFMISADNAHAVHPNHPEKADPTNRPYLNGGIVIKFHGSQKYTTDAVSAAQMKHICSRAGVPYQTYTNRSDVAGGSTLGHISTAHVSVATVDIGLPQLAMHSSVETAGTMDTEYAVRMFTEYFSEELG
ncbi:MAG: M18 family aminopeptidase [Firmicutes bacterium]|nr:M18 family aminopeptidase [Bacillota bacterium]